MIRYLFLFSISLYAMNHVVEVYNKGVDHPEGSLEQKACFLEAWMRSPRIVNLENSKLKIPDNSIFILSHYFSSREVFWASVVFILISLLKLRLWPGLIIGLYLLYVGLYPPHYILVSKGELYSSPNGTKIMDLSEGSVHRISSSESQGGWRKVELPDSGWLLNDIIASCD